LVRTKRCSFLGDNATISNILLHLHPVLSASEGYEKQQESTMKKLTQILESIRDCPQREKAALDNAPNSTKIWWRQKLP